MNDKNVGKTCLARRLQNRKDFETHATDGIELGSFEIGSSKSDEVAIRVCLWDFAGSFCLFGLVWF